METGCEPAGVRVRDWKLGSVGGSGMHAGTLHPSGPARPAGLFGGLRRIPDFTRSLLAASVSPSPPRPLFLRASVSFHTEPAVSVSSYVYSSVSCPLGLSPTFTTCTQPPQPADLSPPHLPGGGEGSQEGDRPPFPWPAVNSRAPHVPLPVGGPGWNSRRPPIYIGPAV